MSIFPQYNFKKFLNFLEKNQVMAIIIGYIISIRISETVSILTNDIINPLLYINTNKNGKKQMEKIEEYNIEFLGSNFKFGKLIVSILRFVITTYILFLFTGLVLNYKQQ
jgi:large-conductance mechanosensitive channel